MLFSFVIFWVFLLHRGSSQDGNCYIKDPYLRQICYACEDKFYSPKESPMFQNPFNVSECIPKIKMTKELEIFVSDKKCLSDLKCDGSEINPMDDLLKAFEKINTESSGYLETKINLYLLGDQHYILEKDLKNSSKYYFRRRLVSISFSPFPCLNRNISGCKKEAEQVTINLKSNQFFLFVSGSLKMRNIIFNGADMPLENRTTSSCYSNKTVCCQTFMTSCSSPYLNKQYFGKNSMWGIFNLEILGSQENALPILSMESCQFVKLATVFPSESARFGSIITSFDNFANITLFNITFVDCSLLNGILILQKSKSIPLEKSIFSAISFNKISVRGFNSFNIKAPSSNIFNFENFVGRVAVDAFNFSRIYNVNKTVPFLFIFLNLNYELFLGKILLTGSEFIAFLSHSGDGPLIIADLVIRKSNNTRLPLLEYSGSILNISSLIIDTCDLNISLNPTFKFKNVKYAEVNSLFINASQNISFLFSSLIILKIRTAIIQTFESDSIFMTFYNSSATIESLSMVDCEIRNEYIFSLTSYSSEFPNNFLLKQGVFVSVLFNTPKRYISFFMWTVSNKGDSCALWNISVNSVDFIKDISSDKKEYSFKNIYFFRAYFCDYLELKNLTISDIIFNRFAVVNCFDFGNIVLANSLFSWLNNLKINLFFINGGVSNCTIKFANVIFQNFDYSFSAVRISGDHKIYFENISLINLNHRDCQGCSLLIFRSEEAYFKNFTLRGWTNSNNEQIFVRLLRFVFNSLTVLENISFITKETNPINKCLQLIIFAGGFRVRLLNLYTLNFNCNRYKSKYFGNDNGLVTLENFEKKSTLPSSSPDIILKNITIENSNMCNYGVIGFTLIYTSILLDNIIINISMASNGGALSFTQGSEANLLNIFCFDTGALMYGGVIYVKEFEQTLIRNIFTNNTFAEKGGVFFLKTVKNFTVFNINCFGAFSWMNGGALSMFGSFVTISSGLFFNLKSLKDGGGIYIEKGALVKISELVVSESISEQSGGFIFGKNAESINAQNIEIKNTMAFEQGNLIYLDDCISVDVKNISILDIQSDGFANLYIILRKESKFIRFANILSQRVKVPELSFLFLLSLLQVGKSFSLYIQNASFINFSGRLIIIQSQICELNKNVTLSNIYLDANSLYLRDELISSENIFLIIKSMILVKLKFGHHFAILRQSEVSIEQIEFFSNYTWSSDFPHSYVFYIERSRVDFKQLVYYGKPNQNLGAIYAEFSTVTVFLGRVKQCNMIENTCIKAFKSKLFINNSNFLENSGPYSGVITSLHSTLILEGNLFLSNFANSKSQSSVNLVSQKFSNNIYLYHSYDEKENSVFTNNTFVETSRGTSVSLESTRVLILSSNFSVPFSNTSTAIAEIKGIWGLNCNLRIISCNFIDFSSKFGGSISLEFNIPFNPSLSFQLKNSTIRNSLAFYGGAFFSRGALKIELEGNLFENCRAIKNDVGMYGSFGVGAILGEGLIMILRDNIFFNNSASMINPNVFSILKPLVDYWDLLLNSNIFQNNKDLFNFTQHMSFFPLIIRIFLKQNEEQYEAPENATLEISSGAQMFLKIVLNDILGNTLVFDNESEAEFEEMPISQNHTLYIIKNKRALSRRGVYLFNNFSINIDPLTNFQARLNINLKLDKFFPPELANIRRASFLINFSSRACLVGELFISGDQSCVKCPPGKYSLIDPMVTSDGVQRCFSCPDNAYCAGGYKITPLKGFWRSSNQSTHMLECLSKYSCLGVDDGQLDELQTTHGKCLDHSKGPFCYVCEISHVQQISLISIVHYGWTPDFNSFFLFNEYFNFFLEDILPLECFLLDIGFKQIGKKAMISNIMPIVLSLFIFSLWVVISIGFSYLKIKKFTAVKNSLKTLNVTFIIVIVLLFPNIIRKCLELFNCIDLYDSKSTRVLLYSPEIVCWEEEHLKYIFFCAMPGLIIWGFMAPMFIAYHLKKNSVEIKKLIKLSKHAQDPDVSRCSFDSQPPPPDTKQANLNLNLSRRMALIMSDKAGSNESQEKNYVAANHLASKFANSNSESTNKACPVEPNRILKTALALKFLYKGYSAKFYFWEELIFLKKLTLISISCITDMFPFFLRSTTLIVVFSFLIFIQLKFNPYENNFLNNTELYSLITTVLVAIFGTMMFTPDLKNISVHFFVLVVVSNSAFVIYWLSLALREASKEIIFVKRIFTFFALKTKKKYKFRNAKMWVWPDENANKAYTQISKAVSERVE